MSTPPQRPASRVIKKLLPMQPGAVKLSRRYGEALVCVRHRLDATGRKRITTVELVVEEMEVGLPPDPMVGVRIAIDETRFQNRARNEGAWWDRQNRVWRMPKSVALALDFRDRIVESG